MARPVLSANCPSSDKTDDLPFIHARRNMSWNRKSRISKEGVSVEGFDHLVGYYHLSKQQKEVQFHHLLASVLTHLLHSVEFANGRHVLSQGLAGSCRTITCTGAGGTVFNWTVATVGPVMLSLALRLNLFPLPRNPTASWLIADSSSKSDCCASIRRGPNEASEISFSLYKPLHTS